MPPSNLVTENLAYNRGSLGTWQTTFVVLLHSRWGVVPLEFSFLPLAQHLLLEVSHRLQEVFALHIGGWNDDAAVQEFIDTIQEVLSVVSKIGHLVETLQQNTIKCHHQKGQSRQKGSVYLLYLIVVRDASLWVTILLMMNYSTSQVSLMAIYNRKPCSH